MNKIITTNAEVEDLINYLKDKDLVALDTETTGIGVDDTIIGYSICAEEGLAYYVATQHWDSIGTVLRQFETVATAPKLMESLKGKQLIGHNILFDINKIKDNYQVDLLDSVFFDTMLAAHLTDENRRVGLKELGAAYLGASAKKEQEAMQDSVKSNGGVLTKANYELYKADWKLIAEYGAKDAVMTYKLFYIFMQELINENMVDFYFDETMPLLKGPTNDLNTAGLKVDLQALEKLKKSLEVETLELKAYIYHEIDKYIKDKYAGTNKKNTFNIGSGPQLAWLLFDKLGNTFPKLSDAGQDLCRSMELRIPYNNADKRAFIEAIKSRKGTVWKNKTKVKDYWCYLSTDRAVIDKFANKYKWVKALQDHKKAQKILTTYVKGIADRTSYGTIRPNFKQHGTTSGRYSCSNPNFQQLPRDDKRVKSCIVARPGNVFVGADYSQLEPRCFASISQDKSLMDCFSSGADFYSVVGAPIFNVKDCTLFKEDENSFAKKYPKLREQSKVVALATPYGRTARFMGTAMNMDEDEAQTLIDSYFSAYPLVEQMMLNFHKQVKDKGYVESMFGRKRRIVDALRIREMYGDCPHGDLPYSARNLLNLAVNHPIQSAGASITNRAMIAFKKIAKELGLECRIVLQVHDSIIVECLEAIHKQVADLLQDCMENTVKLPGVVLEAVPKVGKTLAEV